MTALTLMHKMTSREYLQSKGAVLGEGITAWVQQPILIFICQSIVFLEQASVTIAKPQKAS